MKVTQIRYCENGCKVRSGEAKVAALANTPSVICKRCEDAIEKWLKEIPDAYALLPGFLEPGSIEKNPESKSTKAALAGLPIRLEVVDLLDDRRGRMWQGTAPAHDRRGAIGTLMVHVDRVVEERDLRTTPGATVVEACAFLTRHRLWVAEQDWVTLLHEDLKQLNREISDAIGNYRRPPVGRCHIVSDDEDAKPCGGGLYPNDYGGVHCARCGNTWDAGQLRVLGMALNDSQTA